MLAFQSRLLPDFEFEGSQAMEQYSENYRIEFSSLKMVMSKLACDSIGHDRILHARIGQNSVSDVEIHTDNKGATTALKRVEDH